MPSETKERLSRTIRILRTRRKCSSQAGRYFFTHRTLPARRGAYSDIVKLEPNHRVHVSLSTSSDGFYKHEFTRRPAKVILPCYYKYRSVPTCSIKNNV